MREKLNKGSTLLSVLILLFTISESNAQSVQRQSIASIGAYAYSDGVLIQQTIGQPYATATYYSKEISYRPGFQQPLNFSLELINSTFLDLSLKVYPNPAAYSVTIESSEAIIDALIQVVDINGKLILNEKVNNLKKHSINCDQWKSGIYFISLYDIQNNKYLSNKLYHEKK